jgi:hypothetical protein
MNKAQPTTQEMTATASGTVQSKVLSRLKQELSFISAYKNMDVAQQQVEKEIEQ